MKPSPKERALHIARLKLDPRHTMTRGERRKLSRSQHNKIAAEVASKVAEMFPQSKRPALQRRRQARHAWAVEAGKARAVETYRPHKRNSKFGRKPIGNTKPGELLRLVV